MYSPLASSKECGQNRPLIGLKDHRRNVVKRDLSLDRRTTDKLSLEAGRHENQNRTRRPEHTLLTASEERETSPVEAKRCAAEAAATQAECRHSIAARGSVTLL